MRAPRLEIDLDKIHDNARILIDRLAVHGISVTGVMKATLGAPEVADVLLRAGVRTLGDSRIENIERLRRAGVRTPMSLIRSPMLSQVDRVVASADVSFNTERTILSALSSAAQRVNTTHGVVLMVELGDLREGVMPEDLPTIAAETLRLPNIRLDGIGTNLACQNGVAPDEANMAALSALADSIDTALDTRLSVVSGGNSGSLPWVLGDVDTGRVNDLRLGESLLLGREPLHRQQIDGLHDDAFTLFAEVIETKVKPSRPWGTIAQTAFGTMETPTDRGAISRTIVAIGHQDTDPYGLRPPPGLEVLGASSDHLIIDSSEHGKLAVGDTVAFQPDYSALVRAMTSPFVGKAWIAADQLHTADATQRQATTRGRMHHE